MKRKEKGFGALGPRKATEVYISVEETAISKKRNLRVLTIHRPRLRNCSHSWQPAGWLVLRSISGWLIGQGEQTRHPPNDPHADASAGQSSATSPVEAQMPPSIERHAQPSDPGAHAPPQSPLVSHEAGPDLYEAGPELSSMSEQTPSVQKGRSKEHSEASVQLGTQAAPSPKSSHTQGPVWPGHSALLQSLSNSQLAGPVPSSPSIGGPQSPSASQKGRSDGQSASMSHPGKQLPPEPKSAHSHRKASDGQSVGEQSALVAQEAGSSPTPPKSGETPPPPSPVDGPQTPSALQVGKLSGQSDVTSQPGAHVRESPNSAQTQYTLSGGHDVIAQSLSTSQLVGPAPPPSSGSRSATSGLAGSATGPSKSGAGSSGGAPPAPQVLVDVSQLTPSGQSASSVQPGMQKPDPLTSAPMQTQVGASSGHAPKEQSASL